VKTWAERWSCMEIKDLEQEGAKFSWKGHESIPARVHHLRNMKFEEGK